MAKTNKDIDNVEEVEVETTPSNWKFNPQGKTNVRNISPNNMSIILTNAYGNAQGIRAEIQIPAGQSRPISNEEIMIKIESQSPSFVGKDGLGSNASLIIEDKEFRKYLGFETDDKEQFVLTDGVLADIVKTDKLADFKDKVEEHVVTFAEKSKLIAYLRKQYQFGKFDSASKIDFVEKHTKMKIK